MCRTIATNRGLGDFGRFPGRFPNNTAKKSRSNYITDSKSHSLTNTMFAAIVARQCYRQTQSSG